ncbi:MAG TPA: chromosome segregation protein SMC [Thermoanaerobaculaceae bacterium]|nr:chromosome segregation protein SMC [Thermoanaerobaculaceae bacterium]HRS14714.1 chromosome segregation protein SMC [Thermoanaerobaculaceae bacterium]
MGTVRLASLTLEGFKSFAGRTELSFPGAIVAIVGPNGAGKSNLADAIAWVLGEQSARLLRSQSMADVIFAGSPRRPALGGASVALHLVAEDDRWEATGRRLEISRRVLRDGTSDYRIGGRRVRLKDVLDHLMDAGLGTRSYAIIEQGRIGQVLSVRATERRVLFEEAAAITKFRARRHEAELKLAETRANLVRLADVASEVRRSLEAARRQARRAERHRELRSALGAVRAQLFAARRRAVVELVARRQDELTAAQLVDARAAAELGGCEAALEALRADLDASLERVAAARQAEAEANARAQRREAEETAARRTHAEALARRDAARQESEELGQAIRDREQRGAALEGAAGAAAAVATQAEEAAATAATAARHSEEAARTASSRAEEARRQLLAAASAASEARNRAHRLAVEIEQSGYQRTRLHGEQQRLQAALDQAATADELASTRVAELGAEAVAAEQARGELRQRHESATARIAELAAARDRAGHARWQAHHERLAVQRALEAARALPGVLARAVPSEKLLGTVADFLDPDPAQAALCDRAWGELLTRPVLADEAALADLVRRRVKGEGRLELVVADRSLPARPSPLVEAAGARPEDLGWLAAALPRVAVADTDEDASRLAAADPELVVLLPGGGRRRGTLVELPTSRTAAPGVLELRQRERALAASEAEAAAEELRHSQELADLQARTAELQQELQAADQRVRERAEALAAATSAQQALHRERLRLERELEALAGEAQRLEREVEALASRQAAAVAEAERLEQHAAAREGEVDVLAREAERSRDAASAARAEAERARGAAALARERALGAAREVERHRQDIEELRARRARTQREAGEQEELAAAAGREAAAAQAELAELLARKAAAGREAQTLAAATEALRARAEEAAAAAERARAAHLASRDAAHAAELTLAEARAAMARVDEAIALTLGSEAVLPAEAPPEASLPGLETEETRLQQELEALGPVNELAVAERDELEERHRFLGAQRRDLERSLASLGSTIDELDQTCAQRFLATLEEANRAFDEVFRDLFGGGEARAELSDPESPLESGIEIRVRPPGKHTQSVLLLSGGEKALAAIALLLALFRIRPSPFCLLDEVDAPLDDVNVERLCRLLRDMSADTQFLLITHNRRTMAHADVLYGVTMEEPGVSRVVSVRLEE